MSTFIINGNEAKVVGYVQNQEVAKEKAGENLIVSAASDLETLSNQQLTELYNSLTGEEKGTFKAAKSDNAEKVFAVLEAKDLSELVRLDPAEEQKVETQAQTLEQQAVSQEALPNGQAEPASKIRKVRDSKLQRMKACFLETNEDGSYKHWTVKELMERCSKPDSPMTERIAHVYISILRSPSDRFVMNITKDKDKGTFVYSPEMPN